MLNLDQLVPYDDARRRQQHRRACSAPAAGAGCGSRGCRQPLPPSQRRRPPLRGPRAIRSIDFRRGADGAGRVIVKLTDPRTPINLRQVGNQIVVDFAGAELPQEPDAPLRRTDFGTPVTVFDVVRAGNGTRIVDHRHRRLRAARLPVRRPVRRRGAAAAQGRCRSRTTSAVYTGERLTLNFQDIETRAVLQLLADASGQNIVVSDSVTGNVTLRLQNVPWDQALDIVLRTKGLDKRQDGQRHHRGAGRGAGGAREGGARRQQGHPGARAAALRVPAGQLRQGRGHGRR